MHIGTAGPFRQDFQSKFKSSVPEDGESSRQFIQFIILGLLQDWTANQQDG